MRHLPSHRHSSRGATIAEGIMVMLIAGLLLSVLPGYYLTYVRIWQRETGRLGAVQRTGFALERIQNDIRSARSISLSSGGTYLTLTMPLRAYDASLDRFVNILDTDTGSLIDGDQVHYYFVQDPDGTGSSGGAICRNLHPAGATEGTPQVMTQQIYPHLNPRASAGGAPAPVFAYDSTLRMITITATAAEPTPSSGTFAPTQLEPKCKRCGADLVRVPTEENPAGEIQCPQCETEVQPTAEIVTYQSRFMLRNQ